MRITGTRIVVALIVAIALQAGVFTWRYRDLLYFRQPVAAITTAGPAEFEKNAAAALSRQLITRRHLETIADAAEAFGSSKVEIQALERAVSADPSDAKLKLKLADALRRSGQLPRAEVLYREVLKTEKGGFE